VRLPSRSARRLALRAVRKKLEKEWVPSLILKVSMFTLPFRLAAAARRAAGRRGRVELFYAYDEPTSAYALLELGRTVQGRAVSIGLLPVVDRGIDGDSAAERKRAYALVDGRRLARRLGLTMGRSEPLDPESVRFLAAWTALGPQGPALRAFAEEAMRRLWFDGDGPVERERYAEIWRAAIGSDPPDENSSEARAAIRANEKRMARSGPYETPAAKIGGRWDFAQDRPKQIGAWLDELGWRVS
jgi:2-hydroxychromene-2-carboxylate isomerase